MVWKGGTYKNIWKEGFDLSLWVWNIFKKDGVDKKGVEKKSEGGLWPSKNYGFDTPFSLNATQMNK